MKWPNLVRRSTRCVALALLVLGALCCVRTVRADEASGTWTGVLEARAVNYYYERSTRVIVPSMRVSVEAPNGIRAHVDYLVDVITSASIAQTGGGNDALFTELRHGIGVGAGKTFSLGDNELDLNLGGIYSTEDDYKSVLFNANGTFSWNARNSSLRLGVIRVDDAIRSNIDATFRGELNGTTFQLGFNQVLSPTLLLGVGYELVLLDGFLGNPYRKTQPLAGAPRMEQPPDSRLRHNAEAQLSWFIPESETTLQLFARTYIDSWEIKALNPELRVYQQLNEAWLLRLRYRFYTQSKAEFALARGQTRYPVEYTGPTTSDPKLSAFDSHQVGARIELRLVALRDTILDFASNATLDISFDYQWCTSSFGNNVIATAGGRLPF
jgi:hypothetical protein